MPDDRKTDDINMADPADRDIHGSEDASAYPDSPKGKEVLYTDGGDIDDPANPELRATSEEEYRAWRDGRKPTAG